MPKNIHTVPHDDGWANVRAGSERASGVYNTQAQAIEAGRSAAQRDGVEHLIHNQLGQIRARNTYGPDNYPPKG